MVGLVTWLTFFAFATAINWERYYTEPRSLTAIVAKLNYMLDA